MQSLTRRTVVGVLTAVCLAVPAAGQAAPRHPVKLPADYAAWAKVAGCESNAKWEILGSVYPDPLGITAANWAFYGRLRFGHKPKPELPTSSAPVAERIIAIEVGDEILRETHSPMPDQDGCWHGGW